MESRPGKRAPTEKTKETQKKKRRRKPKIQMPHKKDLKSYYNPREKTAKE